MPRKKTLSAKIQDLLVWIKGIGLASTVLGGIVLIQQPEHFYYSMAAVYLGISLIGLDLCNEKFIRQLGTIWKLFIAAVFAGLITLFTFGVVLVGSPLELKVFQNPAEYPPGTTIAGITWRPEFTELQVWLTNSSGRNYDDLDVLIRPMRPVAKIGQLTAVSDVSFSDPDTSESLLIDEDAKTNKSTVIPMELLATDGGYRMHCGHLPAHTTIKVVLALVEIKCVDPPASVMQLPAQQRMRDPNRILRLISDDFSMHWKGNPNGDVYLQRPTGAGWVKVQGDFVGAQRVRHILQKVSW